MTQERFLKLLDNPDLLTSISYEELKTLALAYPYAHNLRYLLAIKARQDDHPDFSKNLAAAAAYSLDRTRLFALVAPKTLVPQSVLATSDELVLELKPIELIQRELQAKAPVPVSAATAAAQKSTVPPSEKPMPVPEQALDLTRAFEPYTHTDRPSEHVPDVSPSENKPAGRPITLSPTFVVWASQFNPPCLALSAAPAEKAMPAVLPAPEEPTALEEPEEPEEEPAVVPEVKSGSGTVAQKLAEKSVTENKDLISETLARLYAQQGYREKAIAMYQRLCLAFPDKSAYFAAEIEKLKK